jgi:hypothetical protein
MKPQAQSKAAAVREQLGALDDPQLAAFLRITVPTHFAKSQQAVRP